MVWYVIIAILLVGLLFILFTPIILKADTDNNEYSITWWGVLQARAIPDADEILIVRIRMAFFSKWLYPFSPSMSKKKDVPEESAPVRRQKTMKHRRKRIQRLLRSFRVRVCDLNIDTGNVIWNAWLYPVFGFLSGERRNLKINYTHDVSIHLIVTSRLTRILYAFIR